jgi:hypothetical protein
MAQPFDTSWHDEDIDKILLDSAFLCLAMT